MSSPRITQNDLDEAKPKKSKPKERLTVVFDPGTSLSKILYVVNNGTVKWMTMGAEYLSLPSESAESLPIDSGMGLPEDNAWVRLDKSGECHAVGFVANNYRATTSIKKLKQESLMFKILATIGAIAQREKLGGNFNLELGVLLPLSEYRLEHDWSTELKSALSGFYFQTQRLKVRLSDFLCMPEGYGIAMTNHLGSNAKKFIEGNTAIIMLGYRNTSCLFFRRGTVSKPESGTTNLGFYTLLDKLIEKVPSFSREDVLKAIKIEFKESWERASNNKTYFTYSEEFATVDFASLVKSSEPESIQFESAKIKNAYDTSLNEYWSLLKNWLEEILPRTKEIDAFVFAGGSYDLLHSYFTDYVRFLEAESLYTDSAKQLKKYLLWCDVPGKERFMRSNLALRFADAWGFFVDFAEYDLNKILDRHTGEVIAHGE
ncbi:MAG: ParM/StbA family protein [Pleurocapsa sp. MO_192.B19]|nr:ParM/StbA family protein [Pleurocapsa sp. MO_192.B19]